jgi:hypothetical protein
LTKAPDEMWQGSAHHKRADQEAERLAEVVPIPARCDLHAHRIDPGQEESSSEAREQQQGDLAAQEVAAGVARRPEQRAGEEGRARRIAVGEGEECKDQGAGNKAELHGARHVAENAVGQSEAALQVGQHGIAGEP